MPKLMSLLRATASGSALIEAYEIDLVRPNQRNRQLIVNAHTLDDGDTERVRLLVALTDVTEARAEARLKDDLVRDKALLMQEVQHRVANSLQIIASVLMQSARRVQSEETRLHLHDAHSRVMSIAMLQKQLAVTQLKSVALKAYFADLCRSISASMIDDPKRLVLKSSVDSTSTNSDVSVSMGLIVTELVINAIKHAFRDRPAGGKITVSFAEKEGAWLLAVSDNGTGMGTDNERGKPGLGTGIVDALAKQLDATVTVLASDPGTRVEVRHGRPRQ